MDHEEAHKIYQECLNMNLTEMLDLITEADSDEERDFYTVLYNFVLRKRQEECIANGVF